MTNQARQTARLGYSPGEVADSLGISRPYVHKLLNSGELESFKLGRRRIITADSVTALIQRRMEAAA